MRENAEIAGAKFSIEEVLAGAHRSIDEDTAVELLQDPKYKAAAKETDQIREQMSKEWSEEEDRKRKFLLLEKALFPKALFPGALFSSAQFPTKF